jgi:DNA-nicking Smr family endonuclease
VAGGEIDLHGLTVADSLTLFTAHYNARLRAGDTGPIRVIHGYGSSGRGGDLRAALRELVYPKHPLPAPSRNPRAGRR